jgi:ABC-type uncharacterized transport system permease subunit
VSRRSAAFAPPIIDPRRHRMRSHAKRRNENHMPPGTLIICSAVGYAIAFALEIVGVRRRFAGRRIVLDIVVLSAVLAHSFYLVRNVARSNTLNISTADWLLWAAWLMAVVCFAALFYLPRSPTGLVLLPIILGLILSSHWASTEPLASERSFYIWGMVHGLLLLLGTVAVCVGFLAGLMYLAQSYALKHARSSANRLRLPSLEWLERVNSRALALSAILIALGFASGVVMSVVIHRGEAAYALWTDPVVLSLAAMLLWLAAAEGFRLVYPAARRGRKVAYLTLASFVFLVIALASFTLLDTVHSLDRRERSTRQLSGNSDLHPDLACPGVANSSSRITFVTTIWRS